LGNEPQGRLPARDSGMRSLQAADASPPSEMPTDVQPDPGELLADTHHQYVPVQVVRDDEALLPETGDNIQNVQHVGRVVVVVSVLIMTIDLLDDIFIEHLSLTTSMYRTVQILTTIGYGDITPRSEIGRLLCVLLIMVALVVPAHFINEFANRCAERHEETLQMVLEHGGHLTHAHDEAKDTTIRKAKLLVVRRAMIFGAFVLGGTVFFATYENCSCSFGRTAIDGCDGSSYESCVETGGQVKSWVIALYMSIVTLTTVGFGDVTPQSWLGRLLAIPWMLLGVVSTAALVSALSAYIFDVAKVSERRRLVCLCPRAAERRTTTCS